MSWWIAVHVKQRLRWNVTFRLYIVLSNVFHKIVNTTFSRFVRLFWELLLHFDWSDITNFILPFINVNFYYFYHHLFSDLIFYSFWEIFRSWLFNQQLIEVNKFTNIKVHYRLWPIFLSNYFSFQIFPNSIRLEPILQYIRKFKLVFDFALFDH